LVRRKDSYRRLTPAAINISSLRDYRCWRGTAKQLYPVLVMVSRFGMMQ
jgi:hypothetical protein